MLESFVYWIRLQWNEIKTSCQQFSILFSSIEWIGFCHKKKTELQILWKTSIFSKSLQWVSLLLFSAIFFQQRKRSNESPILVSKKSNNYRKIATSFPLEWISMMKNSVVEDSTQLSSMQSEKLLVMQLLRLNYVISSVLLKFFELRRINFRFI